MREFWSCAQEDGFCYGASQKAASTPDPSDVHTRGSYISFGQNLLSRYVSGTPSLCRETLAQHDCVLQISQISPSFHKKTQGQHEEAAETFFSVPGRVRYKRSIHIHLLLTRLASSPRLSFSPGGTRSHKAPFPDSGIHTIFMVLVPLLSS